MYKFYVNVDTDEVCQIYVDETAVTVPSISENSTTEERLDRALFFSPYLDDATGVWSDCYMPINLAVPLFGRYYVLPAEVTDSVWVALLTDIGFAKNTSCVYKKLPGNNIKLAQTRKILTKPVIVDSL